MSRNDLQQLAHRQLADYDARTPGMIFAEDLGELTIDDAYRIQLETARLRRERGEEIAGYKIGCVSPTVQRQLGVPHPVFGHVFRSEIRRDGAELASGDFDGLGIEGEFAVRIAEDVDDPRALEESPERYIAEVFPVIELHNYVFRRATPGAVELIADNALHAGIVVGGTAARGLSALEISVSINGEPRGAAKVDPAATLPELARLLGGFGIRLRKGDIALTGSPLPLYRVSAGDEITVHCEGIGGVSAKVSAV